MTRTALAELVLSCAPLIAPDTARALVQTESAGNSRAVGVVGNALTRQPRGAADALATADALSVNGWDFSVGLGQINLRNLRRLGLITASALEPCTYLRANLHGQPAYVDRVNAAWSHNRTRGSPPH